MHSVTKEYKAFKSPRMVALAEITADREGKFYPEGVFILVRENCYLHDERGTL